MSRISRQNIRETLNEHMTLVSIIKGIVISFLITIPFFAAFSLALTYTDFPEKYVSTSVIITTVISIIVAGSTATSKINKKGWINGAIVGTIYMLVLYILSSISFRDFSITRQTVTMIAIGILSGSIGGIIGVNLKYNRSRKRAKA
ncbi:MAG TPA: TIGR04086 family membrane protein [Pseudobacteroides sp.]|uniref:TIGR04086 family membrane protein n=1 Tax=Pseudobacteroides sp. TaxID=1968840 RepID=UPI002F932197